MRRWRIFHLMWKIDTVSILRREPERRREFILKSRLSSTFWPCTSRDAFSSFAMREKLYMNFKRRKGGETMRERKRRGGEGCCGRKRDWLQFHFGVVGMRKGIKRTWKRKTDIKEHFVVYREREEESRLCLAGRKVISELKLKFPLDPNLSLLS